MGFPMAINLRKGLHKNVKILICDVSSEQIQKYKGKVTGEGEVV